MLTAFDHVTIAVRDPDAARTAYACLLGSAPSWQGDHPELGTRASLFGLSNALVELVGPRDDAPEAEGLRSLLDERGEGMHAIAFATDDATALVAAFRARGLRAAAPEQGEARGADGTTRSYRTVELSPRTTRGLSLLAVERADAAALRAATPTHAGAAVALDHVVIRTSDISAARALYGDAGLGLRLALEREMAGTAMLFFRLGGVTIEVVQDRALAASDAFYGVAYRVLDLDVAYARLREAGLDVTEPRAGRKPGTRVLNVRSGSCGVPTLILHDPTRNDRAPAIP